MVPVRGGSRGIIGKNKRNLNGKPLLAYTLECILKISKPKNIVVATDHEELKYIASNYDVNVFNLPKQTGKETLDDVALIVSDYLVKKLKANEDDILLTIQATCPFIKGETIKKAIDKFKKPSTGSVVTAMDARHLYWQEDEGGLPIPAYQKRVNRQSLPAFYRESGAVIGARIKDIIKSKTRIITPVQLITISSEEGLDIDDFNDWKVAESILSKKKIFIKADSSKKIGMGHLYRSAAIAYDLAHHSPIIFSNIRGDKNLSSEFFKDSLYQFHPVQSDEEFVKIAHAEKPELIILDQLNTTVDYIISLKKSNAKVITFEDMGKGAKESDLLISDLYKNYEIKEEKQLHGIENSIMNPTFEWIKTKENINSKVNNILIIFGGTDPLNLSLKTLRALEKVNYKGNITLIQGMGKKEKIESLDKFKLNGEVLNNVTFMPEIMMKADLAISSAGRTVTELMKVGVPTLCMCQNEKEMTHTHASQAYGVLNLGLGDLITLDTLSNNLDFLIENYEFRKHMHKRVLNAIRLKKSNKEILKIASDILKIQLF